MTAQSHVHVQDEARVHEGCSATEVISHNCEINFVKSHFQGTWVYPSCFPLGNT